MPGNELLLSSAHEIVASLSCSLSLLSLPQYPTSSPVDGGRLGVQHIHEQPGVCHVFSFPSHLSCLRLGGTHGSPVDGGRLGVQHVHEQPGVCQRVLPAADQQAAAVRKCERRHRLQRDHA